MMRMRGARVVTHHDAAIHVSGHARADEISEMIRMLRPQSVIPVHGEEAMLRAQAELAIENGVAPTNVHVGQNGDVLEVDATGLRLVDQIESMAIPAGSDGLPLGAGEPG
jgi:ribonuclease J